MKNKTLATIAANPDAVATALTEAFPLPKHRSQYPITPNWRINAPQEIAVAGHGVSTVTYAGRCPVSGVRLYNFPGSGWLEHMASYIDPKQNTSPLGGTYSGQPLLVSYYTSNDRQAEQKAIQYAVKAGLWLPLPKKEDVYRVQVCAVEWFDKANGNSYFSGLVYANGHLVSRLRFQYGYGSAYQYAALEALEKIGLIELEHHANGSTEAPHVWAKRTGIEYVHSQDKVAREGQARDLVKIG